MTQAQLDRMRAILEVVNTGCLKDCPVTFQQLRAVLEASSSHPDEGAPPRNVPQAERCDLCGDVYPEGDWHDCAARRSPSAGTPEKGGSA